MLNFQNNLFILSLFENMTQKLQMLLKPNDCRKVFFSQSYEIKSPPWTILWFRILGIFSVEYIKRLCVFMFQTCSNSQLLRRVLWISAEQPIGASLKHKNTQPLYIVNRENPQNSEPKNGPRRGLDFIALAVIDVGVEITKISIIPLL